MGIPCSNNILCDACEKLNAKIAWLDALLAERDTFIVDQGKWLEFTEWLQIRNDLTIGELYNKSHTK